MNITTSQRFLLGYGDREGISHVVTLVKCADDRWYVQDATFDTAYLDEDGHFMPFDDILRHLMAGESHKVHQSRPAHRRLKWMVSDEGHPPESSYIESKSGYPIGEGLHAFPAIVTYDRFLEASSVQMAAFLDANGLDADPVYMILYPISIEGDEESRMEIHELYQRLAHGQSP